MNTKRKKWISFALTIMMVLTMLPTNAFANIVNATNDIGYVETAPTKTQAADQSALKVAAETGDGENTGEGTRETSDEGNCTLTFYNRDAEMYATVEVVKGQAIGEKLPETIAREDYNAYWAIGEIVQSGQGNEIKVTGARIDASYVPTADATLVPDYSPIEYTVTFYAEDGETVKATRKVTADTNYGVADMPEVPAKEGYTGKWVYQTLIKPTRQIHITRMMSLYCRLILLWKAENLSAGMLMDKNMKAAKQ